MLITRIWIYVQKKIENHVQNVWSLMFFLIVKKIFNKLKIVKYYHR